MCVCVYVCLYVCLVWWWMAHVGQISVRRPGVEGQPLLARLGGGDEEHDVSHAEVLERDLRSPHGHGQAAAHASHRHGHLHTQRTAEREGGRGRGQGGKTGGGRAISGTHLAGQAAQVAPLRGRRGERERERGPGLLRVEPQRRQQEPLRRRGQVRINRRGVIFNPHTHTHTHI